MNLSKNEGFLTSIPCISIPEYGQSNAPLVCLFRAGGGGGGGGGQVYERDRDTRRLT